MATTDVESSELRSRQNALYCSLDAAPFTRRHRTIWLLAAMGIMLDGFDLFIMGVALPIVQEDFGFGALQAGLVVGVAILGAIVGASVMGRLTDKLGRNRIFMIDLALFSVFALASAFAWDIWSLIAFRFCLGVGVGADYPIAASIVSETMPRGSRQRLLVGAFSFQAVGMLLAAVVGAVMLAFVGELWVWRLLLGIGVIPAVIIEILRRKVPDSPRWHAQRGDIDVAERHAEEILGHPVPPPATIDIVAPELDEAKGDPPPYRDLFRRGQLRRTIYTAVPWFAMDISVYGIGVFTPVLIGGFLHDNANTFIAKDLVDTEFAAFVDVFLIIGFVIGIWLIPKVGAFRMQCIGFVGMIGGLCVLGVTGAEGNLVLIALGFFFLNILQNAGPNSTTYLMPAIVYPTRLRATGHGFATAAGKAGAFLGVFGLPQLLDSYGESTVMFLVAGAGLVGLVVTIVTRPPASSLPAGARL